MIYMSSYKIKRYSYARAKQLGVNIKVSSNKNKKIDVFKDGKKVASIGDVKYLDFPSYRIEKGKEFAENRRRLYRIRHRKTAQKIGSPSYYAMNILW